MSEIIDHRIIPKWGLRRKKHPGEIIKGVMKKGPTYPYYAWRVYLESLKGEVPGMIDKKAEFVYHAPIYESFYRYFYALQELGLIRKCGAPQVGKAPIARQYYELVPEYESHPAWRNPIKYLYPQTVLGIERYQKLQEDAIREGISIREALVRWTTYPKEISDDVTIFAEETEQPEEYFRAWDTTRIRENIIALGRTQLHIEKVKRPAEVLELQKELKRYKTELETCKREIEELRVKPPVPPSPVEDFINMLDEATRTRRAAPIKLKTLRTIRMRWDEISDDDKIRICTAFLALPPEIRSRLRAIPEIEPEYTRIEEACSKLVKS